MATITRTISASYLTRLINAICTEFNYDMEKLNGETKAQFSNRMLDRWLKGIVLRVEKDSYYGNMATHLQTKEDDWKQSNLEPTDIEIT